MTLAEELRQVGRQEGREEGRQQERVAILSKLLQLKFGELPAEMQQKVQRASLADLERWTEQVLTATTLEEALQ